MSNREPVPLELGGVSAETFRVGMTAVEIAIEQDVLALVTLDKDGRLGIIPRPGVGVRVMKELAQIDFSSAVRVMEEWHP